MSDGHVLLALDLGAESGRGILVTLAGGKVGMEEVHRWPNRPVRMAGTLHWDFPFLLAEIKETMRIAAERSVRLAGIAVDTWGVDFGLLGCDGKLLGNPVHYRDTATENIHEYSDRVMSQDKIFELTAYVPWHLASLFRLLAFQRDGSPLLSVAKTFLNMPDLFNYFLTGEKACDRAIANTSNLMGVDGQWCRKIIRAFDLPDMFPPLVEPGTVLGPLSKAVGEEVGLGQIPVVTTCGHDTSAAVAAVPAQGDNWAYISCGTWSILGALIPRPVAAKRCRELFFTNEYTIGGWYLGCNISGLWLVQQLRGRWDRPGDPWDYNRMTAEAQAASSSGLIDVADASLLAPADMEEALLKLLGPSGAPGSRGELVRIVLESLALEYNRRLDGLGELVGKRPRTVFMVGGGIANRLLCQLTANACGVPVYAGADQCTALGNALVAAVGLKILGGPDDIRQVMRDSTDSAVYEPQEHDVWAGKREQYAGIVANG
ncbi:MAG TPA: FGGY-family carbohydrate kinase [Phycisphaerae bacterium]|nr:FGGY-family carbohydrate kinase [Phycisphaerae bacterium]